MRDLLLTVSGPTSHIAFTRNVFRAIAAKSGTHGAANDSTLPYANASLHDGAILNTDNPRSANSLQPGAGSSKFSADPNCLPPAEEMEGLIHEYFSNTALLFPYVDQQEFLRTYNHIKELNFRGRVRRTWLGLLNMVLAMAVTGREARRENRPITAFKADTFHCRAQKLCNDQMLRGTTLETGITTLILPNLDRALTCY